MRHAFLPLIALAGLSGPAGSHPHIFVDATAGFRFDAAGHLTALRITWTYDAFTSLVMFDQLGLDMDGDGQLDDADRAAIVAGETDWPPDYNGDVHLDLAGTPVPMGRPQDGSAWMEDDRVSVAFDLPLGEPIRDPGGARLRLYDPFYYYAYTVLSVDEAETAPCAASLIPFEPDELTSVKQLTLSQLSREETPEQEDVGALFADTVTLECR